MKALIVIGGWVVFFAVASALGLNWLERTVLSIPALLIVCINGIKERD